MIYHSHRGKAVKFNSLADLNDYLQDAIKALTPVKDKFDCIVVRGMSGVILGIPLGLALEKPVCILRKHEKSHQSPENWINKVDLRDRCLFVDDFISSGKTRRTVEEACEEDRRKVVGHYLYRDDILSL